MNLGFLKHISYSLALLLIGGLLILIGLIGNIDAWGLKFDLKTWWQQIPCLLVGTIAMIASVIIEVLRQKGESLKIQSQSTPTVPELGPTRSAMENPSPSDAEYLVEEEESTFTWKVLGRHCIVRTRIEVVALRDGLKGIPQSFGPSDRISVQLRNISQNVAIRSENLSQPASNKKGFFVDFQRVLKKGDRFGFEIEAEGKTIGEAEMPPHVSVTAVHITAKLTIRVIFPTHRPQVVKYQEYSLNDQSEATEVIPVNSRTLEACKTIPRVKYGNTYYLRWDEN